METKIKGKEGIRLLFEKTLKAKEKVLRTALSGRPLVYLGGEEFADHYMKERTKRGISLKSLRFSSKDVDSPGHKHHVAFNKEVRRAPEEMELEKSVVLWDDYVALIETDADHIQGTIIQDKENADAMIQWFEDIWSISEKPSS